MFLGLLVLCGVVLAVQFVPQGNTPLDEALSQTAANVQIDKDTYLLHEIVIIRGSSFSPLSDISIYIVKPNVCGNDTCLLETLTNITTDSNGQFETSYE